MFLKPKVLFLIALFQIALGLGWLIGSLLTAPTVACYEWAARHGMEQSYQNIQPEGLDGRDNIVLQPYDYFNQGKTAPLPVVSLHRESSLNSFASYPPAPMDYTVLFRHLYEQGAKNVYVMSPFVWDEEPDTIVKAAVGYELDRFNHKTLGRPMSESGRQAPLPDDLARMAIPGQNIIGQTDHFPRADKLIGTAPQLTTEAPILGTFVENSDLFTQARSGDTSPPLFVRWENTVIPTLPLIAALNALKLTPQDVKIIPGKNMYLGNKRTIPLDEYGRIPLAEHSAPTLLDTQEVIIAVMPGLRPPDTSATRTMLAAADAVIVSEPAALTNEPDVQALLAARTVRSIMGSLAPAPAVLLPVAPVWSQWVIILDVLLLSVCALRFRNRARFIIWGASILLIPILAWYLFSVHGFWFPFMAPVTGIICIALAGRFLPQFAPPDRSADDDDEDEQGAADGGTASRLPLPEHMYQEPNEIPIPHHPGKGTPPS